MTEKSKSEALAGQLDDWIAELEASSKPQRRSVLHYEIGRRAEASGDLESAIRNYRSAIDAAPSFRPPLFALMRIYELGQRHESLLELYEREAKFAPGPSERASALTSRAALLEDHFGGEGAAALYARAIKMDPHAMAPALMLERSHWQNSDRNAAFAMIHHRALNSPDASMRQCLSVELAMEQATPHFAEKLLRSIDDGETESEIWPIVIRAAIGLARRKRHQSLLRSSLERMAELAEGEYQGAPTSIRSGQGLPAFGSMREAQHAAAVLRHELACLATSSGDSAALDHLQQAVSHLPNDPFLRAEQLELESRLGHSNSALKLARGLLERCGEGTHQAVLFVRVASLAPDGSREQEAALAAAERHAPASPTVAALRFEHLLESSSRTETKTSWFDARARRARGNEQAYWFWRAAALRMTQKPGADATRTAFVQAAEASSEPEPIWRELYGMLMHHTAGSPQWRQSSREHLLSFALEDGEQDALLYERYAEMLEHQAPENEIEDFLNEVTSPGLTTTWANGATRLWGILRKKPDMTASAHTNIADDADSSATQVAHRCAAARIHVQTGELSHAAAQLEDVLEAVPRQPYALALLEEVLHARGDAVSAAHMLLRQAKHKRHERTSEVLYLKSAYTADRAGHASLASEAYLECTGRHITSSAVRWSMYMHAVRTRNRELEEDALSALAGTQTTSQPSETQSIAAFLKGERYSASADETGAVPLLRAALRDESVGAAAAIGITLCSTDIAAHNEAIGRLLQEESGAGAVALRRALGSMQLSLAGDSANELTQLIHRVTQRHPRDIWARYAMLRQIQSGPDTNGTRAEILRQLANMTEDPEAATEWKLHAAWTADAHATPPPEQIASLAEAILLEETAGPRHESGYAEALGFRISVTTPSFQPYLRAARARTLVRAEQLEEGAKLLEDIVQNDPDDLASWEALRTASRANQQWARFAEASDVLAEHAEGAVRASILEECGICLLRQLFKPEEAEARLRDAFAEDAFRYEAFETLREILRDRDAQDELSNLLRARATATHDPAERVELLLERASALCRSGQLDEAISDLKQVIVSQPTHAFALGLLAETLVRLERWEEAVQTLRKLARSPDLAADQRRGARYAAARYLRLKLHDPKSALAELEPALTIHGPDVDLHRRIAEAAEAAQLYPRAIEAWSNAAALADGSELAVYERRAASLQTGPSDAVAGYQRALSADPVDLDAAESLASLLDRDSRCSMAQDFVHATRRSSSPLDIDALRRIQKAAVWMEDPDLEFRALTLVSLLGDITEPELNALHNLQSNRWKPRAQSCGAVWSRLAQTFDVYWLRVCEAIESSMVEIDGTDPSTLGLGRRDRVKPKDPRLPFDEIVALLGLFELTPDRIYVGELETGDVRAVAREKRNAQWIFGSSGHELSDAQRFRVAALSTALRTHTSAIADRGGAVASQLLQSAAAASGAAVHASDRRLTERLQKALPRRVKRLISGLSDAHGDPSEFCATVRLAHASAGLCVSDDLDQALRSILGGKPSPALIRASSAAQELLRFWLSEEIGALRQKCGLTRTHAGTPFVRDPQFAIDSGSLRPRPSGFFGAVTEAAEWQLPEGQVVKNSMSAPPAPRSSGIDRVDILLHLAERAKEHEAGLRAAASELLEASGNLAASRTQCESALESDPQHIVALRNLRRIASKQGEWATVATLLETESSLSISHDERAFALTQLAHVSWHRLHRSEPAESAARRALSIRPQSAATALFLSEVHRQRDNRADMSRAIERMAGVWRDPRGQTAMCMVAGAEAERNNDPKRAYALYRQAHEFTPTALEPFLGIARTALSLAFVDASIHALKSLAERAQSKVVAQACYHFAARLLHWNQNAPSDAMNLVRSASHMPAALAWAQAAEAAGARDEAQKAFAEVARFTERTERAVALVRKAELLLDANDLDRAEETLHEAQRADQALHTIRVVFEHLARKRKDHKQLARLCLSEGFGPLAASAKLYRQDDQPSALTFLRSAMKEPEPTCASVLFSDLCAESEDTDALVQALRREASEEPSPAQRANVLLMLADPTLRASAEAQELHLEQALQVRPSSLILRQLAFRTAPRSPSTAASLWLQEANRTDGPRAAFAATWAGRLFEREGMDPAAAYEYALKAVPGYRPALWGMESCLRNMSKPKAAKGTLLRSAKFAPHTFERAMECVRAALVDTPIDTKLLSDAQHLCPDDHVLAELRLRVDSSLPWDTRRELLDRSVQGASPSWDRTMRLREAFRMEQKGLNVHAIELARDVLMAHPVDAFAHALLDRLEPTSEAIDEMRTRLWQRVDRATESHAERGLALAQCYWFELGIPGSDRTLIAESLRCILDLYPEDVPALRGLERHAMETGDTRMLADAQTRFAKRSGLTEAAAHARFAVRLARGSSDDWSSANNHLRTAFEVLDSDLWTARQLETIALRQRNDGALLRALNEVAEHLEEPLERACIDLRAAEIIARTRSPLIAESRIRRAYRTAPDHPLISEIIARLAVESGEEGTAADNFALAASTAKARSREARLWHQAGTCQQRAGDAAGAIDAFSKASRAAEERTLKRDALVQLALAHRAAGNPQAEHETFRKVLELVPNDAEALSALSQPPTAYE